ncbi:MAG: DNA primase [Spirochaetales bacterium]
MNNKGYDDDFKEKLKFNNDIVSVIGKYVTLQQKGKSYWGCCPFHNEKTPSFAVNATEQYYHCFGCGESGDVIKFVEKIENTDFMSAVKILADNAGMEIPDFLGDESIKKNKEKKDLIYKANKDAAIYYNKMLFTEKGKFALNYLFKRGVNKETIMKFGLGASIDWTSLVTYLKKLGHKEQTLLEAGLVAKGNNGYYDIMAERLMFPIIDSYNNVIGFSGRALKDGKFAKYRNTEQTLVFDKGKVLYGINLLKKLKQKEGLNEIILVEGQMDAIAVHNAGFGNAVASMGTALTKYHAKEFKRFVDKVVVSFDGDAAGQKATFRSLDILQEEDLNVYVIALPENLDPDEYIKKYGKEAYAKLVKEAVPLNDYKIEAISKKFDLTDNREIIKFIETALEEVAKLKKISEREIYLKMIADKTKVDVNTLQKDLDYKLKNIDKPVEENRPSDNVVKDANYLASEFILASVLHKKDYAKLPEIVLFENDNHIKLHKFLDEAINDGKEYKIGNLFTIFSVDETPAIKEIIDYNFTGENPEKYFNECVKNLQLDYLFRKQKQLITEFEKETDAEKKNKIMQDYQKITKEIKNKKVEG